MTDRRCCPIACNGQTVLVTENLFHFLRILAQGPSPGLWWIDALCINQDNVVERNEQILKMREIYTTAISVMVWLGDADEYTVPALELLNKLGAIAQEKDGWKRLSENDPLAPDDVRDEGTFGFTIDPSNWKALKELYARRWFARVWIHQEIFMAQHTVYGCGNYSVDEEKLLTIAYHIAVSPWAKYRGFTAAIDEYAQVSGLWIGSVDYVIVALDRMRLFNANYESKLQHAFNRYRGSKSTDPRDKVYALLGFNEGFTAEKQSYRPIVPDYTKSVPQVYIEATQYLLNTSSNLSILSTVEDRVFRKLKTLPSWVPDYSVPFTTGIGRRGWSIYSASRTLKAEWQIKENGTVLSLNALLVDTISHVGVSSLEMNSAPWRHHEMLSIVADMDEYYINGQTKVEAFWRTLIGNLQLTGAAHSGLKIQYPAPDSLSKSFRHWLLMDAAVAMSQVWREPDAPKDPASVCQAIKTTLDNLSNNDTSGLVPCADEINPLLKSVDPPELVGQDDGLRDQATAARPYLVSLNENPCKRFFRTANGLMGVGPLSLGVGDSIWLVPGADVFFVLREIHGTKRFEFMGDAYVHGLMQGEALENTKSVFTTVELE